jgi:hypothetical protein
MLSLFRHYRHLDPNAAPQMTLPITVAQNYHYAGGTYGDVDMPVEPLDHQLIDTWAGAPLLAAAPDTVAVQVRNISGVFGRATTVGNQLAALGFRVTGSTNGQAPASTSETVIRYHPGSVGQALSVLRSLSGAVMMHGDPNVADGSVVVDVGSAVAVTAATTTTTPTTATPASSAPPKTGSTTPGSTTTTPSIPTAGGQPPSSAVDQPQPFDPIACP